MMFNTVDVSILIIISFVMGIVAASGLYVLFVSPIRKSRERRAYMQGFFDGRERRRCNADNPL